MRQLLYVSAAAEDMTGDVLTAILETSRRNNRASGITGMLLHVDGGFLQVLEGPDNAIQETFTRIRRDPRHTATNVLVDRQADERLFPDWTMGFDEPLSGHPDTAGIFEATRTAIEGAVSEETAAEIAILLRTFYRVNAKRFEV